MKLAYVFAGQGRRPSRGQLELATALPGGAELLGQAAAAAGLDGREQLLARGGRALNRTSVLQPVVVAVSVTIARALPEPDLCAGHSLGELSAVAAAGGLEAGAAVRLAAVRGAAMQLASVRAPGGLYAIRPAELDRARDISDGQAFVALDNAPDELILGGDEATVRALAASIPGRRLSVAGPFHGPAMAPAAEPFEAALEAAVWADLRLPVVSSVEPDLSRSRQLARQRLVAGLTRPVRFREALLRLYDEGARTFVTVGPGQAVRSLLRRTLPRDITVLLTETQGEIDGLQRLRGPTDPRRRQ